jgi:hypothetical protein
MHDFVFKKDVLKEKFKLLINSLKEQFDVNSQVFENYKNLLSI